MVTRIDYADTVSLTCLANEKTVLAEILEYKPAYALTCSVDRSVKIYLRYDTEKKIYIGNVGNLEFVSEGPSKTITKQGR